MALGLAFFRLQDKKETQTPSFTVATQGSGYTWILTRAFPPGWLNHNHRSDRNGFLIGGNGWQCLAIRDEVGYTGDLQTNNSGLKGWPCPHPPFPSLIHVHTMLMSGQYETRL